MKNKTVTLWNIPTDLAKECVSNMRARAVDLIKKGAPVDTESEVANLLYYISRCEEEIAKAEQEEENDD